MDCSRRRAAVERLRNFSDRLTREKFPEGNAPGMAERIAKAANDFDAGLSDDLNTARRLAAVYDLVREVNIAMDKGEFRQGDVAAAKRVSGQLRSRICSDRGYGRGKAGGAGLWRGRRGDERRGRRENGGGAAGRAEAAGLRRRRIGSEKSLRTVV